MDQDEELKRFKFIAIAGVIFLFSAWYSWKEFRYLISGAETRADIHDARIIEVSGRYGSKSSRLQFNLQYTEADGIGRSDKIETTNLDYELPPDGLLPIQYLPGQENSARIAGSVNWTSLVIFFGSLSWLTVMLLRLIKEANTPIPRGSRR